jgi:ATP-dependent Lon protease
MLAEASPRPMADEPHSSHRSRPTSGTSGLPALVARQVTREMDRLRRLPSGSPEAAHVRAYLHCLWSLPWRRTDGENTDLRVVQRILHRDHLGLERAKERILEYLAVRKLKPDLPGDRKSVV